MLADLLRKQIQAEGPEGGASRLVLPQTAMKAHRLSSDPRATLQQMEDLLRMDPVAAAKILQVARSVLYYRGNTIDTLREAIVRVGLEGCRNVVFLLSVRTEIVRGPDKAKAERLWLHSISCAVAAQLIAQMLRIPHDPAFLAGLIHDIGWVAGWSAYLEICRRNPQAKQIPVEQVDAAVTEVHVGVGAYYCSAWGLGESIVQGVLGHHRDPTAKGMGEILSLADLLSKEEGWSIPAEEANLVPRDACLTALSLTSKHYDELRGRMRQAVEELQQIMK